ncbi:MAG: ribosome assembly cofactor RimP [Muribaculaceae bacterium]|nr:ribosome assembly cofactor RimP [Muribaculaceae bacterium]MDE5972257.1 ribosome assembly cofactor RimP [Muribaculaceae bacterium]MDE6461233.1 ribosome assembly cofactor RimP [Muribaculaceae bacterium]MDE6509959.1 ribosome assembly cofactor RimP [Muribaculaceae bacterium]
MIDKSIVRQLAEEAIASTDLFIVDVTVSAANEIVVELDSPGYMDVDTCGEIARAIESKLDRDVEDYELEVGSAGLTSPFKVKGQYLKNIGNEVEVLTCSGRKFTGVLSGVTDEGFTVEVSRKVRPEGAKRPVIVSEPETMAFSDVKQVKYVINFK